MTPDEKAGKEAFSRRALTSQDRARTFTRGIFPMELKRYAEADIPTVHGPFRLIVYREAMERVTCANPICSREHMALVRGQVGGKANVLARVHSECWTAEVMGSLKCDCREQFHTAMERIAAEGAGVVVYLRQEGRGIGLGNKVRAYALQNSGADTVEANLALGFEADARSYDIAGAMLRDLGVQSVRLLTNNPLKVKGLEDAGVVVAGREAHWVGENQHNAEYLAVKRRKMGHHPEAEPALPSLLKVVRKK